MKKIIILNKPKGCRLANQLWNYISIYAYSLEIGARCVNFCFYENKKDQITGVRSYDNYYKYFNIPNHKIISLIVNLNTIINRLSQKLRPLNRYVKYIKNKNKIICSGEEMAFYLEPTKNNSIINNKTTKIYFDGWMFRNPKGIEKYRREIIKYFAPKEKFIKKIESKINKLKSKYNHIVGVHIRKGDYKVFLGGKLYFDDREINKILQEYLKEFNKDKDKTCFLACSDEKINMDKFPGLNIIKNKCGIFGHIGHIDKNLALKCTNTLKHRGPDGFGLHHTNDFCFGHRRLSILDLSVLGKQPMSYADNRYFITFNGEIYNFLEIKKELISRGYKFKSESDTEIILASFMEWREKCLDKFNGMWAIGIWDNKNKELFLSRDRFGKKPLFYNQQNQDLTFASEMKAITPLLPIIEVNYELIKGKVFNYEHTPECLIKDIKRFPAGHFGFFKNGKLKITRYWNTLDHLIDVPRKYTDQIEMFRELFFDACKIRMRSDVPIGTALSGGLDSSSVISVISEISKYNEQRVNKNWQNAFVASFPNTPLDESYYAKLVTKNINIKPNIINIDPIKYINNIEHYLYLFEENYNTSPIPFIATYQAMRKMGIVVTLDGHGADELFGGYEFDVVKMLNYTSWNLYQSYKILNTFYDMRDIKNSSQFNMLPPKNIYLLKFLIKKLLNKKSLRLVCGDSAHKNWNELNYFNKLLYISAHETVLPTLLRNYDRYSMTSGVEIRMPFMDYRIVSFAFSLPWQSKLKNGYTKAIIRDSLSKYMPKKITYRKTKIGFNTPIVDWMRGPLKTYFLDIINSRNFQESVFINPENTAKKIKNVIENPKATFTMGTGAWRSLAPYLWEQSFLKKIKS